MSEGLHSKRPLTSLTSPICSTGSGHHEQATVKHPSEKKRSGGHNQQALLCVLVQWVCLRLQGEGLLTSTQGAGT